MVRRRTVRRKQRGTRRRRYSVRGGSTIRLGILGIFKNEAIVIREWLDHYRWQGADAIVLLDNNSTDNWREQIQGFEDILTVIPAEEPHAQAKHYTTLGLPKLKEKGMNVVCTVDMDEYVFGTDGRTLKEHVVEIFGVPERPSAVRLFWSMFGSSGHKGQPKSVRESFTWRKRGLAQRVNMKSICWVDDIKDSQMDVHETAVTGKTLENPPGLQLNHYAIMSKDYFNRVKKQRGNAMNPAQNKVRTDKYFESYNVRDYEDTQLKEQVERAKTS